MKLTKHSKTNEKAAKTNVLEALLMLGLIITPFYIGVSLYTDFLPIFTQGHWSIITDKSNPMYHPLLGPMIIFEVVGNSIILLGALGLLWLAHKKKRVFLKLAAAFYAFNLLFLAGDYMLGQQIPAVANAPYDPETTKTAVKSLIAAIIFVPYLLRSKVMKEKFSN